MLWQLQSTELYFSTKDNSLAYPYTIASYIAMLNYGLEVHIHISKATYNIIIS